MTHLIVHLRPPCLAAKLAARHYAERHGLSVEFHLAPGSITHSVQASHTDADALATERHVLAVAELVEAS